MLEVVVNSYVLKECDKLHPTTADNHLEDVLSVSKHSINSTDASSLYIHHKSNIMLKTDLWNLLDTYLTIQLYKYWTGRSKTFTFCLVASSFLIKLKQNCQEEMKKTGI